MTIAWAARIEIGKVALVAFLISLALSAHAETSCTLRIVSLAPNLTEACFALGLNDQIVAVTSYCKYPPEAAAKPRVGGLLDSNTELILQFQPTVILVQSKQLKGWDALEKSGIRVEFLPSNSVPAILSDIETIGEISGRSAEARKLAADIRHDISCAKHCAEGHTTPSVLLVLGKPTASMTAIYAQGPKGFLHDLIEAAGGRNAIADATAAYVKVSKERLLAQPPDVIIELRAEEGSPLSEAAKADSRAQWRAFFGESAADRVRIEFLDDPHAAIPGPSIGKVALTFARLLFPECEAATTAGPVGLRGTRTP